MEFLGKGKIEIIEIKNKKAPNMGDVLEIMWKTHLRPQTLKNNTNYTISVPYNLNKISFDIKFICIIFQSLIEKRR